MIGDERGERPSVLFAFPFDASFVRIDLHLMRTFCNVTPFHFTRRSQYPAFVKAVAGADLTVSWFALGFAAVANLVTKALGRHSIVVAGGWDVVGIPEIMYGRLLSRIGTIQARTALSLADRVLAFSDWSERMILRVTPTAKVRRAYLGVDISRFRPQEKEDLVVCVSHVSRENLVRKGLRTFVLVSRQIPEARFVLVGHHWDDAIDELRRVAGDNITFPGRVADEDLRSLLGRAKVYVQPSYTEGFGLALAEAMASECVPVVTGEGAMREVVGDTGFFAPYGDAPRWAEVIRQALASRLGPTARSRVAERFSLDGRLAVLRECVTEVLGSERPERARSSPTFSPDFVWGKE